MIIKAGTLCYISDFKSKDKIVPLQTDTGESYFSVDQEVEIAEHKCNNKNLIAVVTQANSIENLVAQDHITTVVWVNKDNI